MSKKDLNNGDQQSSQVNDMSYPNEMSQDDDLVDRIKKQLEDLIQNEENDNGQEMTAQMAEASVDTSNQHHIREVV